MSDMSNGKTYTEVVAEFQVELGKIRVDFIDRINDSDKAILAEISGIASAMSACEERAAAQDKRIDDNKERLNGHDTDFKAVRRDQKWLASGEGLLVIISGWLGINQ